MTGVLISLAVCGLGAVSYTHLDVYKRQGVFLMSKVLIIGCGGVANVAIRKCCQCSDVFTEICIASRTKSKCDAVKADLEGKTKTVITTAQVDADDASQAVSYTHLDVYKRQLYGFNNLTKALSFNIYDVCYAKTPREQRDYIAYIDEQYNSERLTNILTTLTDMIGAKVLNIARQDYDPQGASVTILIAEGSMTPAGDTVLGHLDKSHVTVHTYPEYHPETFLATFRVDIDVATCGEITPLSTLDYLIGSFDSDIITMDYRVRGFTRDLDGKKLFLDHDVVSIQHYIDPEILRRYDAVDINVYEANLFHTKMMVKDIDLQNYLFNTDVYELPPRTRLEIMQNLRREMIEIFSGRNIY